MSGGFFRGTSADQDTRFSNKQAKLMKSQKFAPELEHLVDINKVKMDVVKPWIATRVTELLGFEDEVLINFIYGLLDGKDVNGKEVQIQITGFMEKNTGKFMKELWNLLLSAQKNASGVPQQFLDAKEEEIRKKKVESDRITNEIQKKKELEQEKQKQMDAEINILKDGDDASNKVSTHSVGQHEDEKGYSERNGFRGKNRTSRSPHPRKDSPSPNRINRSRSLSKSFSNSRSYSDDGHKSRSISRSPQSRGRSISPDRRYRSPRKRSLSPYRKYSPRRHRSPVGRRSPISRRRSPFRSWRRSPSPRRRRSPSPRRRRSPSPRRRRSPSPRRRRSPSPLLRGSPSLRRRRSPITVRRRSPSPVRRRSPSPVRRRSPSPIRRRSLSPVKDMSPSPVKDISPSPVRHRSPSPVRKRRSSPGRRRSPIAIHRRSRTPTRYRSPYPPRRRSPSPLRRSPLPRSPRRRRSPLHSSRQRFRSGSPYKIPSSPYRSPRSSSSDHDDRINDVGPRRYKEEYVSDRTLGKRSPQVSERELGRKRLDDASRRPPISLRSPQREPRDRSEAGRERPVRLPSREISPSQSGSSLQTAKSSPSEDRRASSRSESPLKNTKERTVLADTATPVRQASHSIDSRLALKEEGTHYSRGQRTETPQRRIGDSPRVGGSRNIPIKNSHHEDYSPERIAGPQLREAQRSKNDREIRMKDQDKKSEKTSSSRDRPLVLETSTHMVEAVEYSPRGVELKGFSPGNARDGHPSAKQRISPSPRTHKSFTGEDSIVDEGKHSRNVLDSENERNKSKDMERRKHKRRHIDSEEDSSDDSHVDERKEAKRRRKEEKRLRKEEKRRRREERHRKKEERRAGKLKAKTKDIVLPFPDAEKYQKDDDDSDDQVAAKIDLHPSDIEEAESEQKKLEIELREKALESLRAKKAINP